MALPDFVLQGPVLLGVLGFAVRHIAPLPSPVAGQFVGAIGHTAIVAGGSRWTAPPTQGGHKVWEDKILVLEPGGQWREAGQLPHPAAYGVSLSLSHGVLIAGGQNGDQVFRDVLLVSLDSQNHAIQRWPSLPVPLINFSIAKSGSRIYVLAGQESPTDVSAKRMWSLALDAREHPIGNWSEEPSLPFSDRILASSSSCGNIFYIAGGAQLTKTPDGSLHRHYLRDAWTFSSANGWARIPDLPTPLLAAPAACPNGHFTLFGGDDGHMAGVALKPGEQHPGFSRVVLSYDSGQKTWKQTGELPAGLVTTGVAPLSDGTLLIPGGEDRPGSRSAGVLELQIPSR